MWSSQPVLGYVTDSGLVVVKTIAVDNQRECHAPREDARGSRSKKRLLRTSVGRPP